MQPWLESSELEGLRASVFGVLEYVGAYSEDGFWTDVLSRMLRSQKYVEFRLDPLGLEFLKLLQP